MSAQQALRGRDPDFDVLTVVHGPVGGTSNCSAIAARQEATSGNASAITATSTNTAAPAAVIKGAGDLLDLRNASGVSKFSVSQSGTVTAAGVALGTAAFLSLGAATDIAAPGTQAAGAVGKVADAGHVHPITGVWLPSDNNLLWANYSPMQAGTSTTPPNGTVAGKLTMCRVMLRKAATVTNVLFGLSAVDTTGPISNSYIGLYDSTGALRASTADISTTLMSSATVKTVAFAAPYAAAAGEYFIALLLNGTWSTSLQFKSSGAGVTSNAGLAAPHLTLSSMLTGLSALPDPITLSSQATALITGGWGAQWYGLS